MATSIYKKVFQTPTIDAFSTDGKVFVKTIYKNQNEKSDKDIIVKTNDLEANPDIVLQNFVSYKLQRDASDASFPENKIDSLLGYKRSLNLFLQNYLSDKASDDYFVELYAGLPDVVELPSKNIPLEFKKSSFSTTLMFLLYKTTGKFQQKIFIENDNLGGTVPFFYYDNQFLPNPEKYFVYYGLTANLKLDNGKAQIIIYVDSNELINQPIFVPKIPTVNIYSYTNVNNKLLLVLGKNIGDDISKANSLELFTTNQKIFFKEVIEKKGVTYKDDLIYSVGGNTEKYFVVYRSDIKPESYSEIIKDKNIIKKLDIQKSETSLADNISPNKKYYYCFRTQNVDGTLSDASLVYEIQIIDQSGTIYMTQNIFKPEKIIKIIRQLDFENRVRIYPTRTQIKIPEKTIMMIPVILGKNKIIINGLEIETPIYGEEKYPVSIIKQKDLILDNSIFQTNKIFKARIQSQNSKKKFDLNINYTLELIDGIKLLKDTTITKNFDILKTEELI
jgi:hypothetical protein